MDTTVLPTNTQGIPAELKQRRQWVLWRTIERDGEKTKAPFQVWGTAAKSNEPGTWDSFDAVLEAYQTGKWDGIGYVFAADDPYCGIDLDGCRDPESDRIAPWAQSIIAKLSTYCEVSPSGSGVKLWVRGKSPFPTGKNRKIDEAAMGGKSAGIEMYDRGRYFCVTGQRLSGTPASIERRDLSWLKDQFWPEPKPACHEGNGHGHGKPADVIARARKYADAVDPSVSGERGHDTTFRLACALVNGFDLGVDGARPILYEYSKRCSPPWTERELEHKLESAANEPGPRGYLLNKDRSKGKKHKDRSKGKKHKDRSKGKKHKLPAGKFCDACRLGPIIAEGSEVDGLYRLRRWRGSWLWWADGAYREVPDEEVRAKVIDWLAGQFSGLGRNHTSNVLDVLQASVYLSSRRESPDWLAAGPGWNPAEVLATRDSLIHLPTLVAGQSGYSVSATPRFFTPCALDFRFNPNAPAPRLWLDTLDEWCDGDAESIATLQEWSGYTLVPDTGQQKILFLVGPKRSGKGTFARINRKLVGEKNTAGPTLSSLGAPFGLWPLVGKSLSIIADARIGGRDSSTIVERLLSISGEDALTVDRKFKEPVTCKLGTRIMILTNELPRFADASGALASRMLSVPMPRSFYGSEDHTLYERLQGELPGILLWAIAGWARLHQRGKFVQPAAGDALVEELGDLASPVGKFVRECCIVAPEQRITRADLYSAYQEWATRSEGVARPMDAGTFGRGLRAAVAGIRNRQQRDGESRVRTYEGVGLRQTY